MKKHNTCVTVLLLIIALLSGRVFGYQADVEDISGGKYFPAVKEAIGRARESIYMVMYSVNLRPYDEESSVSQLVNELIAAHKRGVQVTVVLDQNINFVNRESMDGWQAEGKNAWCFKALKEAGINVLYDDATIYTHAKAVVIDGETVILGSANWTRSALFKNFEANVLIQSKELAAQFLENFKKIKIDDTTGGPGDDAGVSVVVSWGFLETPNFAGRMVSGNDNRSLDVYLLLGTLLGLDLGPSLISVKI
ncbi:MAG: phospholipase D-like domain-containing protein [Candidatus Omnitrophota bacterium]